MGETETLGWELQYKDIDCAYRVRMCFFDQKRIITMSTIDFKKVDAAFAHLANDKDGQGKLMQFASALDQFTKSLPDVNEYESQYIVSALLKQRVGVQSSIVTSKLENSSSKEVAGFVIKSAVKA